MNAVDALAVIEEVENPNETERKEDNRIRRKREQKDLQNIDGNKWKVDKTL